MLRRCELAASPAPRLTLRPCWSGGQPGFMVGIEGGPQSLLWRATREIALRDGAAYVNEHYKFDPGLGIWRAR